MKRCIANILLLFLFMLLPSLAWSQAVPEKLTAAYKLFQEDPQLRNGIASLYIVDAKTGQVLFDKNGMLGLAPASTMKVITSASAYELLGKDYRYETRFAYLRNNEKPSLLILPSGDPTFGSWRWPSTKEEVVMKGITAAINKAGITAFSEVVIANDGWNEETIPDGWMWQDVGNYYGAGPAKLNWRENQYDVLLKSGKRIGDPVSIVKTVPQLYGYTLKSELASAAAGTGDNAYIYFPLNGAVGTIRGTIPVNENSFKISGAIPSASHQFVSSLSAQLKAAGIQLPQKAVTHNKMNASVQQHSPLFTVASPPLDSIIYWFNRKSVNLYGEALVKTIAAKSTGSGSTETGIEAIRDFWKRNGIPDTELSMVDGSGLSPLNRVTTHAQVSVLMHARKRPWYQGFYASFPVFNGMRMKSGTINGVKGYCGYHKGKDGREYVFAFLVNNYNGSSSALVQKMYKVLDVLK